MSRRRFRFTAQGSTTACARIGALIVLACWAAFSVASDASDPGSDPDATTWAEASAERAEWESPRAAYDPAESAERERDGETTHTDQPPAIDLYTDPSRASFVHEVVSHLGLDATRRTDLARLDVVSRSNGTGPRRVDRVVVRKSSRLMWLELGGERVATYQIALGSNPEGPKRYEGDGRTPEGTYEIDFKNPDSEFFLSLRISYPNEADIAYAEAHDRDPGGNIAIHGIRNGLGWMGGKFRKQDWTDGCIAVTDDDMLEIWELIDVGTKVVIEP